MSRSRRSKAEPVSPDSSAPRSLFRPLYRLLLSILVFAVVMVFVFPIIFGPRIDVPADVQFASPSSLTVQISNQDLTPLTDVEYGCKVSKLTLASGSEITDASVLNRGIIRKIPGRRAVTARCQTAYLVTAPLKTAEYTLTITYRAYPWPRQRTRVFRIAARFDRNHQLTAWKVD